MKNYIVFVCIMFLVSMIGCGSGRDEEPQSDGKESEPATTVSKEEPSNEDGVITNSIGMKFKLIEAGEFMMGSENGQSDEKPVHKVEMTKPFYIGVYEVTQAKYEEIMGKNPSAPRNKGPNMPIYNVTWEYAALFCKKLSGKEGVKYRLPTEAEWEYACRAGTKTEYYWGDRWEGKYAWYIDDSSKRTHDAGLKKPNAWGLHDMIGNVWEWCSDCYAKDYYGNSPEKDPQGPKDGELRVLRGGGWSDHPESCRSACRRRSFSDGRSQGSGFRVVREVE